MGAYGDNEGGVEGVKNGGGAGGGRGVADAYVRRTRHLSNGWLDIKEKRWFQTEIKLRVCGCFEKQKGRKDGCASGMQQRSC